MTVPYIAGLEEVNAPVLRRGHDGFDRFTHHQWYYHQARQTVYFSVSSRAPLTEAALVDLGLDIATQMPELAALYRDLTGTPLDRIALSKVVSVEEAESLDGYPDAWDMSGGDLFVRHELPMLRIRAVNRIGGPDADGRRAVICVLSTHALFEGVDSALLSRSQATNHSGLGAATHRAPYLKRLLHKSVAAILGPAQLLVALIIAPRRVDKKTESLVIAKSQLRRVAARLGLRQRSLMFALATYAINAGGKGYSRRKLSAVYTSMDMIGRAGSEGAYFRHWVTEAGFRVVDDFVRFARGVEQEIDRVEADDRRETQGQLNAVFGMHRFLRRHLPALYSDRIFRFAGFYHLNLSVTPPHRLQGKLARDLVEPVHAGSFHPGLDMCIFVPGRRTVTFNFALSEKRIAAAKTIPGLLDGLDTSPSS